MGLGITFDELWDWELHLMSCGIGNYISGAVGLRITFEELWDWELHLRSCGIGNYI